MNNQQLLAQAGTNIGSLCGEGLGIFGGCPADGTSAVNNLSTIISLVIGVVTLSAGVYFLFQFIIGGIGWISASGDKQKLQQAQDRITFGVLGMIIVVAAYGIAGFIGSILGLDIFLSNPGNIINQLNPMVPKN